MYSVLSYLPDFAHVVLPTLYALPILTLISSISWMKKILLKIPLAGCATSCLKLSVYCV